MRHAVDHLGFLVDGVEQSCQCACIGLEQIGQLAGSGVSGSMKITPPAPVEAWSLRFLTSVLWFAPPDHLGQLGEVVIDADLHSGYILQVGGGKASGQ